MKLDTLLALVRPLRRRRRRWLATIPRDYGHRAA